ncbi:MAG TPA: YceI family protein [Candidatus Krumholzibacteria bacterium]|nr:YceI family protein [Candidatus Krumholzibacteria bacterium]
MKARILAGFWLLLALVALSSPGLTPTVSAAPEVFQIDKNHSMAGFKIRHLFTQVTGRFDDLSGAVTWDEAEPTKSSVELTIQAASINTSHEGRDEHLRSADFFDAVKYPTLTFKSTKIEKTDKANMFKVHGDLTMRGVTKPVVIDLEVLGFGDTSGGRVAGFNATTKINRQDFGITWNKTLDSGGTLLSDEVTIDFPIEAKRKAT